MPRVKRGKSHLKHRKNILAQTKGYKWGRKSKLALARVAIWKAGVNAYRDRKRKKRTMRALWQVRINAAARQEGTTYSKLMGALKGAEVGLDRKVLSRLAAEHPAVFSKVIAAGKK